jgi:hypothetical protein
MSAQEYRARGNALVSRADAPLSYELILELEATAAMWRQLAGLADVQDVLLAALAASGE